MNNMEIFSHINEKEMKQHSKIEQLTKEKLSEKVDFVINKAKNIGLNLSKKIIKVDDISIIFGNSQKYALLEFDVDGDITAMITNRLDDSEPDTWNSSNIDETLSKFKNFLV